jgi:phenylacetate-CoA ligase
MLVIRGVNVFPSAVENIIKSFPEVVEHRLTVNREGNLDMLSIEIEDQLSSPARVARELHVRLGLRIGVQEVPVGTLPRFEGKARRVIDNRE